MAGIWMEERGRTQMAEIMKGVHAPETFSNTFLLVDQRLILPSRQLEDRRLRDHVLCIDARLERADERQVPVQLPVTEAVADDILVGDLEARVGCVHVRDPA